MQKLLSTKDLATAIGVSESSLRRWTNSGVIATSRTPGGHRRIPLSEAIRYIRDSHATVLKPEILGLQEINPGYEFQKFAEASNQFHQSLIEGDAARARGGLLSMYLSGMSIPALFDGPVREALWKIGELWRHDPKGILIEHRATDICIGAISAIRQLLPEIPPSAPLAIGATPPGDPYLLPSAMAAAVFVDAGWQENNFGPQIPLDLLADAAQDRAARLVWLSISSAENPQPLRDQIISLANRLAGANVLFAVGGRCVSELHLAQIPNVSLMNTMADLNAIASANLTPVQPHQS